MVSGGPTGKEPLSFRIVGYGYAWVGEAAYLRTVETFHSLSSRWRDTFLPFLAANDPIDALPEVLLNWVFPCEAVTFFSKAIFATNDVGRRSDYFRTTDHLDRIPAS